MLIDHLGSQNHDRMRTLFICEKERVIENDCGATDQNIKDNCSTLFHVPYFGSNFEDLVGLYALLLCI